MLDLKVIDAYTDADIDTDGGSLLVSLAANDITNDVVLSFFEARFKA